MEKVIIILVEKFSSHSAEKFRRGTRLCFRKFRVSKNFMPKRGISLFSIENLLSHSTQKLRRGTLQCVTNLGYRKILCFRELCHDFVSNFFRLKGPKKFVEEPF